MPVTLETSDRVPLSRRLAARIAVALARVLVLLSPRRLRSALTLFSRGARPADEEGALRARGAVVAVSVRCAGQQCLQRSVAVALLCRMGGTWPDWCTGVRTEPFRAHAWVEVSGRPVGERAETSYFHKTMTVRTRP